MTAEEINTRIELTEAAIDLYLEDDFTIPSLTKKTGKTASEIYALFPNKKSILQYYYPSLVIRYRAMVGEIEDFESYTISEKLSNFIYTLFDMMDERREFVRDTFDPMILGPFKKTNFHDEIKELFHDFFTTDPEISVSAGFFMGGYFYGFMRNNYLQLVRYWLHDESEGQEQTMALTDKITSFVQEVVYSKVVDKGFDLFKYAFSNTRFSDDISEFGDWISNCFSGSETEKEVTIDIEEEDSDE